MRISTQVGLPLAAVLFALALGSFVCLRPKEPTPPSVPVKDGFRQIYFRCRACDNTWLVYELDPEKAQIREPGGEWVPEDYWSSIQPCPSCGSTDTYFVRDPNKATPKPQ